ncbi:efflux RND transporter periplasmic adaptor subunit [Sphingomonas sp. DG1-23]|uniref:efflux RND transporter periplasmic adaptor subunit n=1 Tax=Sphingomonas sp. DG1-23 TaxID=3068316 RepID=UPI00273FB66C|nr:efflux RND transporter periplasmic adaptor subunit [Sphingomonas sp. DG1-23]MDP5278231.1 efflux RND transporter periplasmic adaptor subunit [Sphingomonas sp. DG1-23]
MRLALGIVALSLLAGCGGEQAPPAPPPAQVTVATPVQREVVDWDDYTGRFVAPQDVEIRPRVNGVVTAIHFRDGQDVRQGAPLFTIDPRPYRAALAQAQAQATRANAALSNARQVTARSRKLAGAQAVSTEELEANIAAERTAAADLAAARAAIDNAQLNLSFTTVRAPFSGRMSDRKVSIGDSVADGQTILTRIVSLDPIWFEFEGAESFYLKNLRQDQRGERGSSRTTANPVQIQLADESEYRWNGRMEFLDNAVDPDSGTIRAHAVVQNPNRFLTPGMFGRARLLGSGTYKAMLIPDEAIVTDQTRRLVYVVGNDNKAVPRPVEVGATVEGLRIVRDGLAPTDRVVITGVGRLQPGAPVQPVKGVIKADPTKQAAPTAPTQEPASGQATVR